MLKKFLIVALILLNNIKAVNKDKVCQNIVNIKEKINVQDRQKETEIEQDLWSIICTLNPLEERRETLKKRSYLAARDIEKKLKNKKERTLPVISFFIPVFNREHVVKDAIDSIYKQHLYVPFEVVVVDDASTDGTSHVLSEYEKKYDNFFYYRHEVNKGAPAARNTAILHCRGKYVFNLDSDDVVMPISVQKLYNYMEANNIEVSFFGEYHFFNDYNPHLITLKLSGNQRGNFYTVLDGIQTEHFPIACGCRLYTKKSWERVGGYLEAKGQDTWSFSYMQLASGCKAYVLPEVGYLHRTWTTKECYTLQQVHKNWDESPLLAVKCFPEILSPDDFETLKNYTTYNGQFLFDCLHNKRLKLLKPQQLEALFKANNLLETQQYKEAVVAFMDAIERGCTHLNVYLNFLKACWYAHDMRKISIVLDIIKSLIK